MIYRLLLEGSDGQPCDLYLNSTQIAALKVTKSEVNILVAGFPDPFTLTRGKPGVEALIQGLEQMTSATYGEGYDADKN